MEDNKQQPIQKVRYILTGIVTNEDIQEAISILSTLFVPSPEAPDQRDCSLCTRGKLECVCNPKEVQAPDKPSTEQPKCGCICHEGKSTIHIIPCCDNWKHIAPDKIPSAEEYFDSESKLKNGFDYYDYIHEQSANVVNLTHEFSIQTAESYAQLRESRAVEVERKNTQEVLRLAVSAIYFSDSADYLRNLYQIVNVLYEGEVDIKELFYKLHPENN